MFRHSFIFTNVRMGVTKPGDLAGRRIGVQGYQMTAAVWIRGLLRRDFGVDLDGVDWFEGGVNEPGVIGGAQTSMRPRGKQLSIQGIGDDRTLSDMLAADELDAIIGAVRPNAVLTHDHVRRMFANYHEMERDYYRRTRIFPIMHALVIREELYRQHPELAANVYTAFEKARNIALAQTRFTGSLRFMLPWMIEELEEIESVFGDNFWRYGVAANAPSLNAFNQFLVDDGFLERPFPLDQVFVPVN
jgi:4,5-dihydroxyphthalate decarboxylase